MTQSPCQNDPRNFLPVVWQCQQWGNSTFPASVEIRCVRIINISAAENLRLHLRPWSFWVKLKRVRKPGGGYQHYPQGTSPVLFRSVPSFAILGCKGDVILYLPLVMLHRSNKIMMGSNCGSVERTPERDQTKFKFHVVLTPFNEGQGLVSSKLWGSFSSSVKYYAPRLNSRFREKRLELSSPEPKPMPFRL